MIERSACSSSPLRVTVWGARGSTPVCGPQYARYGGNTICVEVRCGSEILIFDAGTGIVPAGKSLVAEGVPKLHLFFSHCHYDHVQGLPFFAPLHRADMEVSISYAQLDGSITAREMIEGVMRPPYFPVGPNVFKAKIVYNDFLPNDVLEPSSGVVVRTGRLRHPGGAIGYRIEFGGKAMAIITDTEHVQGEPDQEVLRLIRNADLLLYDSAFSDEEMPKYHGYGHSSWQEAIRLAEAAQVRRVGLFHHAFFHMDSDLDHIAALAKERFSSVDVVHDGQTFDF